MPDGVAASARSMPAPLPPLNLPPTPSSPAAGPSLTMPPAPVGAPPMGAPSPMAPPAPPTIHQLMPGLQAQIQDNGMTVYSLPPLTLGGQPQIVDVAPPPKIPRALQPPKGKAQN